MTTLTLDLDRLAAATQHIDDRIVPALQGMPGFASASWMVDETSGTALNVAFWETEDAVRLSEAEVAQLRDTAASLGATVESVGVFRVTNQA